MANFIEIKDLKEGNILISPVSERWNATVVGYSEKLNMVECQFISGACRYLDQQEVNEDFKSLWAF